MAFEWYVTPIELDIARQNGISRATLDYRIQNLAWDKTKAISTPPKERKSLKEWRATADRNGIPYPAFQKRVHVYMWDEERAATEPLQDRKESIKKVIEARRKAISERGMVLQG